MSRKQITLLISVLVVVALLAAAHHFDFVGTLRRMHGL